MAERARYHTKFVKRFDDLGDLEKVQAAESVAATMDTPGWRVIVDLLEGRKAELMDELVRGEPVRSRAEYAAKLAEARGIAVALDAGLTVLHVGERSAKRLSESEGAS